MQEHPHTLVLGTHNRKKRAELAGLLEPLGLRLVTLDEVPDTLTVEESGTSFAENARLKASVQAVHLNSWVLGEDSGLVVDALAGQPGIYSARFSGPGATDQSNNEKLLALLAGIPPQRRGAHYVCAMALADSTGTIRAASVGRCYGRIALQPAGTGGFGYDPLMEIVEYHRTFGQIGPTAKAVLSHRARAARQLAAQIARLALCQS